MANVAHATLTGADLHEPKGAAAAAAGTVYISDGAGSGSWGTVASSLNFVGMVAPFMTLTAPTGWLEFNGAAVSRTTYADLWAAVTIQQTGTRSSGSAVITGLSSTTNMKVGYYVGGTGITNGSTIVSVDSSTQITISNNASSSGSNTVIVSGWAQGDGSTTFTLPDATTNGSFFRSRTSSVRIGAVQSSQNLAHTHTTDSQGAHSHGGATASGGVDHTHPYIVSTSGGQNGTGAPLSAANTPSTTGSASAYLHTHTISSDGSHTHTALSDGGTEARPVNISMLWCVKY